LIEHNHKSAQTKLHLSISEPNPKGFKVTTKTRSCALFIVFIMFISACTSVTPTSVTPNDQDETLTDNEILEYSTTEYDKAKMMHQTVVLGNHNGVSVIAEFPCSDLCPDYTTRIVRYDIDISQCSSVGGVIQTMYVPRGIALVEEDYCVPKILVEN